MISGPQYHQNKLKFIQLSRMEENKLLVVIVVEGNLIKNAMVNVPESVSQEDILNLNILLNSALNGLSLIHISPTSEKIPLMPLSAANFLASHIPENSPSSR